MLKHGRAVLDEFRRLSNQAAEQLPALTQAMENARRSFAYAGEVMTYINANPITFTTRAPYARGGVTYARVSTSWAEGVNAPAPMSWEAGSLQFEPELPTEPRPLTRARRCCCGDIINRAFNHSEEECTFVG